MNELAIFDRDIINGELSQAILDRLARDAGSITTLNLYDCTNLTTLPDLSKLTNLTRLNLRGCANLQCTPELIRQLAELEERGCRINYPAHFNTSALSVELKSRLDSVITIYQGESTNQSKIGRAHV